MTTVPVSKDPLQRFSQHRIARKLAGLLLPQRSHVLLVQNKEETHDEPPHRSKDSKRLQICVPGLISSLLAPLPLATHLRRNQRAQTVL